MSSHRFLFYHPEATTSDATITLEGNEHHHLARVLRVRPGETAYVTDGRGLLAECTVESVASDSAALSVRSSRLVPEPRKVTLALALLKKDRFAQALEQSVELGLTRCLPFTADRSRLEGYGPRTMERLRRVAVSAMKQSFRPWLTRVEEPVGLDGVLVAVGEADLVLVADQDARRWSPRPPSRSALVIIGPEAGLSADEAGAFREAGGTAVSVSPHRLRSETAAAALVAAVCIAIDSPRG